MVSEARIEARAERWGRGAPRALLLALLGSAPLAAPAAVVMQSPTGFSAFVTLTDFDDLGGVYDGSFTISLGPGQIGGSPVPLQGTVAFDAVDLNKDIHAVGGITIADNPMVGVQKTYTGDTVFSGLLQIDRAGTFTFDGVSPPSGYPQSWTVTYDGAIPDGLLPILPPLPALSGAVAGSLTFTVHSVDVDLLVLAVAETVDAVAAPGWSGFEAQLDDFDLVSALLYGGTRGTIDFALEIAPGSQINTPLPGAFWLLGSALMWLGARRTRDAPGARAVPARSVLRGAKGGITPPPGS